MPDPSGHREPSPLLRYFASQLREILPPEEQLKLDSFDPLVQRSSSRGDLHRAVHCARWAVELAGRSGPPGKHTVPTELGEIVRALRDTEFGISFGFMVGDVGRAGDVLHARVHDRDKTFGVLEDLKIQMVNESLTVAKNVGDSEGWDSVPWEALMSELVHAKTD